jgi:hypothetical protein
MTAQVATTDDRLWARERQDRSIRNGPIVPDTASDKPQVGEHEDCCPGLRCQIIYVGPCRVTGAPCPATEL